MRNSSIESKDAIHEENEREKIKRKEHGPRLKGKGRKKTMKLNQTRRTSALSFTSVNDRLHM
jgi:hypothetical protein